MRHQVDLLIKPNYGQTKMWSRMTDENPLLIYAKRHQRIASKISFKQCFVPEMSGRMKNLSLTTIVKPGSRVGRDHMNYQAQEYTVITGNSKSFSLGTDITIFHFS